jgi:hypothetical protein
VVILIPSLGYGRRGRRLYDLNNHAPMIVEILSEIPFFNEHKNCSNYDAKYDVFYKLVVYQKESINHNLERRHQW